MKLIQENITGAKDFMPTFDYISGKSYMSLSDVAKNKTLDNLGPISNSFAEKTLALSGSRQKSTLSELNVVSPNWMEHFFGIWVDGKPTRRIRGIGDGTVLRSSSEISGAINKAYVTEHLNYLSTTESVNDTLEYLGLSPIGPIPFSAQNSTTAFFASSPNVKLSLIPVGNEVIVQPDPNVLFVINSEPHNRTIKVVSQKDELVEIKGLYSGISGKDVGFKTQKGVLLKGAEKVFDMKVE